MALETGQGEQRNQVAGVKAVGGGIEAAVDGDGLGVQPAAQVGIGNGVDEPPTFKVDEQAGDQFADGGAQGWASAGPLAGLVDSFAQ